MKLMSKKKKSKTTNLNQVQKVLEEKQTEKSNTLVFGGVLIAMTSIGMLIFVLSEKVFNMS